MNLFPWLLCRKNKKCHIWSFYCYWDDKVSQKVIAFLRQCSSCTDSGEQEREGASSYTEYVEIAPALIGLFTEILYTKEGGAGRGRAVRAQGAHG